MPPITTWTDVMFGLGVCVAIGTLLWILKWLHRRTDAKIEMKVRDIQGALSFEDVEQITVHFDRSSLSLILCVVPFLGLWFSNTCMSLLRDYGFNIFPWVAIAGPSLMGLLFVACGKFRLRLLRKVIARRGRECSSVAAFNAPMQTYSHDENPYAPPRC